MEEYGTILSVNAFVHQDHSQMESHVLNALLDNYMLMEVVIAQMVHSLMEFNVPLKLPINVLEFQIQTGMELIVSVSQDLLLMETPAIVQVLLWVTIVKDVHQNQTQSGAMVFVNAIMDMLMFKVFVHSLQLSVSNAMSEHISILNFKNVFHALMDVYHAKLVMIVLCVDLIIFLIQRADFVSKFVVMEKDIL